MGGIDPRYAEKQSTANGFRYRDWVAMHASKEGTQHSRLAAHAITLSALHTTKIPWLSGDGGMLWVKVGCTVPPHNSTVFGPTLKRAVEARFLHDMSMLPVAEPGQTVHRANAEVYTEGPGSVSIVYAGAPQPGNRFELMSFEYQDVPPT
jgi:hypothetical protein